MAQTRTDAAVARGLPALIAGRFLSNLGFRLVFPFLPTIARGLDTSLASAGAALAVRDLTGLAGLPLGSVSDRGVHRRAMVASLLVFAAGCALAAASPGLVVFGVAMAVSGLGKLGYDTAMGAWIGERVPFHQRGRVVGITELSWAASFLVGMPVVAVVIDATDWRTPLAGTAVLVAASAWWVRRSLDPDTVRPARSTSSLRPAPGVAALVVATASLVAGHQLVLVTFGAWFEDDFGLDVGGLGLVAVALGLAELIGTGLTVTLTDRIGKLRSMAGGALAMAPAAAVFALADRTVLAVLAVAGLLLAFEFAFISALPLATELHPEARGATLGALLTGVTCTRAVGAVAGTALYERSGMGAVGAATAVTSVVAAVVASVGLREPEPA